MIFFKIFQDFSPQATHKFAAGEKTHSPQAKKHIRRRRKKNSPQAKKELAAGDTHYKFSQYQSMVSAMPRAKSYSGW